MFAYICIIPGCITKNGSHLSNLKSTSYKWPKYGWYDGWYLAGYLVTKTDDKHHYYNLCKKTGGPHDFWAFGGFVHTKLYGCGHAKIDVGNCWKGPGKVLVYINGALIGEVIGETKSKIFEFAFKEGSVLKLVSGGGIFTFNNFEVTDCICEN